jgi:hypothetical protein
MYQFKTQYVLYSHYTVLSSERNFHTKVVRTNGFPCMTQEVSHRRMQFSFLNTKQKYRAFILHSTSKREIISIDVYFFPRE